MILSEFLDAVCGDEQDIIKYTPAEALEAVKQNGDSLQYVNTQTEDICLEAVKQNGEALQYVNTQTEDICLEAVKKYGEALRYVNTTIFEKDIDMYSFKTEEPLIMSRISSRLDEIENRLKELERIE